MYKSLCTMVTQPQALVKLLAWNFWGKGYLFYVNEGCLGQKVIMKFLTIMDERLV